MVPSGRAPCASAELYSRISAPQTRPAAERLPRHASSPRSRNQMPCRRPCCISARLETAPRPPRPPRFVALGEEEEKERCASAGSRNEFSLRHAAERLGQAWAALAYPHRKRRQRSLEGGIGRLSSCRPHLQRPGSGGRRRQPPASRPPRGGTSIRSRWAPQSPRGN